MSSLSQEILEVQWKLSQRNPTEEEKKSNDNEESISKRSIRKIKQSQNSEGKSNIKLRSQGSVEQHKEQPLSNKSSPFHNQNRPSAIFDSKPASHNIFGEQPNNIFATIVNERGDQNIFAKTANTINLFDSKPSSSKSASKQELPNPSMNLLAGMTDKSRDDDSESSLDECESVLHEDEKSDPKESKASYNYESDYTKVFNAKVARFKANQDPLQTELMLAIEKPKSNESWSVLALRNCATGLIVYQALLIASKTKVEPLMGKQENAIVRVWKQSKEKDSKKFEQQTVKIQFENAQKCQQFADCIKTLAQGGSPVLNEQSKMETVPAQASQSNKVIESSPSQSHTKTVLLSQTIVPTEANLPINEPEKAEE